MKKNVDPSVAKTIEQMEKTLKELKGEVGMEEGHKSLSTTQEVVTFAKGSIFGLGRRMKKAFKRVVDEQTLYDEFKKEREDLEKQAQDQIDAELQRRHGESPAKK